MGITKSSSSAVPLSRYIWKTQSFTYHLPSDGWVPPYDRFWILGSRGPNKNRNRGHGYLRKPCQPRGSSQFLTFHSYSWYSTLRVRVPCPLRIPRRHSLCISVIWECLGPLQSVGCSSEPSAPKIQNATPNYWFTALYSPSLSHRC